ncbi:DMT family transporter [Bacillus kexueae]|uniref:DMT family transporter n=1 Tax=Aeribacillus kexueae TaxID=2078952 RepID=UPI001FB04884|nr:multidrug efflux SMR transporter [Bacillus kexueae]
MNRKWLLVLVASVFEVGWVIGLKHADNVWEWIITAIAMIVSFWALIYTSKFLPTSTVYAVFVGLGTAGTVAIEMFVFGERVDVLKLFFIGLLLFGVVGLKLVSNEKVGGNA